MVILMLVQVGAPGYWWYMHDGSSNYDQLVMTVGSVGCLQVVGVSVMGRQSV